jgi:glycosyltransferase involved in cell wall biosynthesis
LKVFERIFACSAVESECVLARSPSANVLLLPNVYPYLRPQPPREADGQARLLYVGTFGYYPNLDAVLFFCKDVLPIICSRARVSVELDVIGSGLPQLSELAMPGVNLIGAVSDTTPYYARCDASIVPLRAGAGTRIKILESFSHQRAVVATTLGAQGLAVETGVQLFIADSAEAFAASCLRIIENSQERDALAKRGNDFFTKYHTLQKVEDKLPQLFGDKDCSVDLP